MIAESLLGGIFGGVLRLAPEVLKFFDKKEDRKQELALVKAEIELVKAKSAVDIHRADSDVAISALDAVSSALEGQSKMAVAAGKTMAFINALVRPAVTYWYVFLYSSVKIMTIFMAYASGQDMAAVLAYAWTNEDMTIYSMILSFWFIGRVWEKQK